VNLVCDESVESQVVARLRGDGHAVVYVAELSPSITDDEVLAEANARQAPLITADKDFGELVFRQGRANSGVALIRLAGLAPDTKARSVSEVIAAHSTELAGAFTVISPGLVRIRRSP
jgi:predicted nuclease of predicted toxin-antitoxin system